MAMSPGAGLLAGQVSNSGATIGSLNIGPTHDNDAMARISSQDTSQIYALYTRSEISLDVYNLIISQLGSACSALGPAFTQLTQRGVDLMKSYSSLSFAQQTLWIRADLRFREAVYAQDHRDFCFRQGQASTANDISVYAISQRMNINFAQIQHLKLVEAELAALVQPKPAATAVYPPPQTKAVVPSDWPEVSKVLIARAAGDPELKTLLGAIASRNPPPEQRQMFNKHVSDIRVAILGADHRINAARSSSGPSRTETKQAKAAPLASSQPSASRAPLQPLPTNPTVKVQPQSLKRKREKPEIVANTQIIPLADDASDDEQQLQDQLDALQSKIAAIRARTSHEDDLVTVKKTKKAPKTAPLAAAQPSMPLLDADRPQPPSDPLSWDDPFRPPPSPQDVRFVQAKADNASFLARSGTNAITGDKSHSYTPLHGPNPQAVKREVVTMPAVKHEVKPPPKFSMPPAAGPVSSRDVVDLTSSPSAALPAPAVTTSSEPLLCAEQQRVVDLILAKKNVFYTGSAGCGKSTVLKTFVPLLRDQGRNVRIVAPTGKAALDINGSTTWTYAGWTPGHFKQPLSELLKAAHGKFVNRRFKDTDVLVIDEISMVENHLLQRLDAVMKEARGNMKAFGGVQLVVTGDFCQLPPVKPFQFCMYCGKGQTQRISAGKTVYRCPEHGDCKDEDKWAFRSRVWADCKFQHINLSKIHRQKDEVFIKILQKLRVGTVLSTEDRQLLLNHPCDVTNAVKLFPRRVEVKRINDTEFDRLKTAKHGYTCLDFFALNEVHGNLRSKGIRNQFDDSLEALREHRLENRVDYKVGMLVVLLVNLDITAGLVNGSQGRIVGFEKYDPSKLPKATVFAGGESRTLSSQRKPAAGRPGSGRFGSSQKRGRQTSMEPEPLVMGELRGEHAILREGQIRQFLERPCNSSKQWPIVEFDNGIKRTIFADCQVNELGDEKPYTLLARTQIPLIAAWAMTIHKSQGMTLNKVIVDLGNSFEEGQEYVALSRARGLDGLKVVSLGAGVGKGGNEQVREFLWEKFKIR